MNLIIYSLIPVLDSYSCFQLRMQKRFMASNHLLLVVLFLLSHFLVVSTNRVETMYYAQKVDHIKYGNPLNQVTFKQRYYIDRSFWKGAKETGPILVYLGGEFNLEESSVGSCGLITKAAPQLGGLVLFIEHRFYGLSVPYGSIDIAMSDPYVRACLSISQALVDFHEIISGVKRNLSAQNSPVIVMGGSYAGVLAALFRVRYPTLAMGALASSAPMFFDFSHSGEFYSVISRVFQEINHDCHDKIRQSWKVIDDMAMQPGGLDHLSEIFSSCDPLETAEGLKSFLVSFYTFTAQYSGRFSHWINIVCDNVVDPSNDNVVEGVAKAINATYPLGSFPPCMDFTTWAVPGPFSLDENSTLAWNWQLCSELMIPFHSEVETMFPPQSFNFSDYLADCYTTYGTPLNPWASTEKNDIKTILGGYTSNIIFSNGLKDPYSTVGVLEDISETVVAINTKEGSHCLDLAEAKSDDPKWLVHQRKKETRIFMDWIRKAHHSRSTSSSQKPQSWFSQLVLSLLLQYLIVNKHISFQNMWSL